MKKIILLSVILFSCSCEVVYDLNISDIYNETLTVYPENNDYIVELYPAFYDDISGADEYTEDSKIEYYNSFDNIDNFGYHYSFTKDNYNLSTIVNSCYNSFVIEKNGNIINFATNITLSCFISEPSLEKVTINITDENGQIENSNAHKVENNKHTWIINRSTMYDANIEFTVVDNYEYNLDNNIDNIINDIYNNNTTDNNETIILLSILGVFVFAIIIFIYFKAKKSS